MATITSTAIRAGLGVLLLVSFSSQGRAGEFNAFGPKNFVRGQGKPVTETHTFTVLNPNAAYSLRIDNGGASGEFKKVSTATVWLNGVRILAPNRFSQFVPVIVRPIGLAASNQLVVEVGGKPGSGFTLRFIGLDNDPPTITASVSPPANAAGWHNVEATVSFECSDATSGIASCTGPVLVSDEGAQQVITGTAVDRAGASATVSVSLNVDKTPPTLSDFLPSDGDTVTEPEVNLTGLVGEPLSGPGTMTCSNSTEEEAVVNEDAAMQGLFVFACTLPLVPGANPITVQATDVAGNVGTSFLTVHHLLPPHVSIESPENLAFFLLSPITVTGTIDDPSGSVLVNDVPASVDNGTFTASVPLGSGFQTITAVAQNVAGSDSDSVDVFVVLGSVPTVKIDSPPDGFILGHQISSATSTTQPYPLTVSGWVRDNRLIPSGEPEVTVRFDGSPMTAAVTQGSSGPCLSPLRCWRYTVTQPIPPPTGVHVSIEVEAQTGGGTASRHVSGIVDFCIGADGGCGETSVFQGHDQNRSCILHSDGCSNPITPARKDDPTEGSLGRISTAFGRDEDGLLEGAPTVFGQVRPIQLPCNRHDECYHQRCPLEQTRTGMVDDKLDCNDRFLDDMQAVCRRAYPEATCPVSRVGLLNCPQWRIEKAACYGWARVYKIAVDFDSNLYLGFPPYLDPQPLTHCVDCPTVP